MPAGEKKIRLKYFDVAKALAIIAVITGHTAIRYAATPIVGTGASTFIAICFTFHLPLFFFVSGFFIHVDRPFQVKKELRALILPYAVTAAAVVAAAVASNLLWHDMGSTRQLFKDWTSAALYGAGDIPSNPLWPQPLRIGAIWFLLALFWSRLLTLAAFRTGKIAPLFVAALFVAGLLSRRISFLPLSIQAAMCATLFVYLGSLARKYDIVDRVQSNPVLLVILLAVWVFAILNFNGWGMAMADYGASFIDVLRNCVGGISSALFILAICKTVEDRIGNSGSWSLLARIGTLTLTILCVHLFEDDVLRWGWVIGKTQQYLTWSGSWMLINVVRVVVDTAVAFAITKIPAAFKRLKE